MQKNTSSNDIEQALESRLTLSMSLVSIKVEVIPMATVVGVMVEDHLEAVSVMDVEVTKMSNVTIATSLNIMHHIAGSIIQELNEQSNI